MQSEWLEYQCQQKYEIIIDTKGLPSRFNALY